MLKQLEAKYELYGSVEEMLTPETLSELLSRPVSRVEIRPMTDHGGAAGSKLSYVETDDGRFVLKQMSMEYDILMYATNDQRCRSVRLWQYGLLDELRPGIEHKIIACTRDVNGWGILMNDLSDGLFGVIGNTIPPKLVPVFLDRMARLHARFWNDPRLEDPRIGLGDHVSRLKVTSLTLAQDLQGDQMGGLLGGTLRGWKILESLVEPDLFQILSSLSENPEPLAAALEKYPFTLIHGDYRDTNLAFLEPDQLVAFDWHLASRTLMTVDLAWFANLDNVRNSIGKAGAIRYYRNKLESYLGTNFEDDTWQAMLDLGHLIDAVFIICLNANMSKHAGTPEWKDLGKRMVKERIQQVRDGLRWL